MRRSFTYQLGLTAVAFLLAAGLQTWAFTEPSATPPSGDAYAPLNTGPYTQDKRDVSGNTAWITADGLGSRYGAILASLSGNVGIGTTTPVAKLEVKGDVRIGDTTAACTGALAGDIRYHASVLEYCNGSSWTSVGSGGGTADLCSVSGNILGGTHTYAQCCTAGGTVTSIGGGNYVCKFTGASCTSGWSKYLNWTTTSPSTCNGANACGGSNCVTGVHAFSNTAPETCSFTVGDINGQASAAEGYTVCGSNPYYGPYTCTATITEVGCQ